MQRIENMQSVSIGYQTPTLTITVVTVEKGFQATGGATNDPLEDETYE